MADEPLRRGAKPLSDKDWIFGSRPRRQLLEGVLIDRRPTQGWSRGDLADLAGVVANGGVDEQIDGLERLRLLARAEPGRWHPGTSRPRLGGALRRVLVALEDVSSTPPLRQRRAAAPVRRAAALRALGAAELAVASAEAELGAEATRDALALLAEVRRHLGGHDERR